MFGRRPQRGSASASTSGKAAANSSTKKRKWQESEDESSDDKITAKDMEKWKAAMREEEKQEQMERERQERKEQEAAKRRKKAEAEEKRRKEAEEAQAAREAEEARKNAEAAEAERRKVEQSLPGYATAGPLPLDLPTIVPSGVAPGKEHLYKTSYCKRWEQGNCNFGTACHFAHGERELRGKPPKGSNPGTLSISLPAGIQRPVPNRLGPDGLPVLPAQNAQALPTQSLGRGMPQVVPPPNSQARPPQVVPPPSAVVPSTAPAPAPQSGLVINQEQAEAALKLLGALCSAAASSGGAASAAPGPAPSMDQSQQW